MNNIKEDIYGFFSLLFLIILEILRLLLTFTYYIWYPIFYLFFFLFIKKREILYSKCGICDEEYNNLDFIFGLDHEGWFSCWKCEKFICVSCGIRQKICNKCISP